MKKRENNKMRYDIVKKSNKPKKISKNYADKAKKLIYKLFVK